MFHVFVVGLTCFMFSLWVTSETLFCLAQDATYLIHDYDTLICGARSAYVFDWEYI